MIDTVHRVETPEGIEFVVHPAGPISRGLAFLIDLMIRLGIIFVVSMLSLLFGQAGGGLFLVCLFLVEWFYPVFFEVYRQGQTPGKRSMGLRVIHSDGTPVGVGASVIRNLLRVVDMMPVFYIAGVVSMLCTRDFQRLGDMAAGTMVVAVFKRKRFAPTPIEVEGARAPAFSLGLDEQRAISNFAERSGELSEERLVELADLLPALTQASGREGARELLRIANFIAGRR
jgi:uncharacterized RDD family membrane protein YckC